MAIDLAKGGKGSLNDTPVRIDIAPAALATLG
jgi:hypothetical protein